MKREVFEGVRFDRGDGRRRAAGYQAKLKRRLDLVGVAVLAPFALIILVPCVLILRMQGGPVFFTHRRVGRYGNDFDCWKLRTMVPNARDVLRRHLALNPAAAREWADNYKLARDPRVTLVGTFLRRTSLDELPQLWNVIKGEMSLVGPRPVTRDELIEYRGFDQAYFSVRPGLTGLWQVEGRGRVSYPERVKMDVDYVRRASLRLDLTIIVRTIGVVLAAKGR